MKPSTVLQIRSEPAAPCVEVGVLRDDRWVAGPHSVDAEVGLHYYVLDGLAAPDGTEQRLCAYHSLIVSPASAEQRRPVDRLEMNHRVWFVVNDEVGELGVVELEELSLSLELNAWRDFVHGHHVEIRARLQ